MGIKNIKTYRRRRKALIYTIVYLIILAISYTHNVPDDAGIGTYIAIPFVILLGYALAVTLFEMLGTVAVSIWEQKFGDKTILTLVNKWWNGE